jgi:hypothetical protein
MSVDAVVLGNRHNGYQPGNGLRNSPFLTERCLGLGGGGWLAGNH